MIAEDNLYKYATSEGRSGKIAIIGGDSTATASMDTIAGKRLDVLYPRSTPK